MRQAGDTCPQSKMHHVEVGQDTPHAVDLGVISVDLRRDEKHDTQEDGHAKAKHERVRLGIDLLQTLEAGAIVEDSAREGQELGNVRLDCLVVVGAVGQGSENWETHDCNLRCEDVNCAIVEARSCWLERKGFGRKVLSGAS